MWYVSSTTAGAYNPATNPCGSGCIAEPALNNQTLHISKLNFPIDDGASYNGFNDAGGTYNTSKRIDIDLRIFTISKFHFK